MVRHARWILATWLMACALVGPGGVAWAQADADEDEAVAPTRQPSDPEGDADVVEAPPDAPADSGVSTLEAGKSGAYRLELRAPRPLRQLLLRHLDLARFRDQDDISRVELARLVAATPAQARSLLEPAGYFQGRVEVRREDREAGPPTLVVQVEPGPQARVGRVQLEMQGAFADAMDGGDAALRGRWERLNARWPLQSGQPFSQPAWTAAKNALLASLRARGYPGASFTGTGAEVDATSNTVRLFVVVDSGPLFRLGEVRVEGLERTPAEAAVNVKPFSSGEVYSERLLLDYQEALQKTGLYEGVAVEIDLDPEQAGRATVVARLREASLQSATVSVGYSSNTGPRVGLEHTHRRPFGRDLVASTKLRFGSEEREAAFDLTTYPEPGGYRNLLGVRAEQLDAGGARTETQRLRVGRTRDTQRIDRLYYLEFNRTTVETLTERRTDRALFGNYEWVWRDVNNLVFPTRGVILSAQAGFGGSEDADGDRGPFTRLYLQGIWYQRLGAGWLAQARAEAAQVIKRDGLGVPDSLLFRAGGDNSVRGYGYRTLGPVRDGAVVGGPVLATGSIELMRRISTTSARWRDWYYALFVDAGNAATEWGDLDPVVGYGVGLRWRSPIGPLRVDLAYGQKVEELRLHLSVGVTF